MQEHLTLFSVNKLSFMHDLQTIEKKRANITSHNVSISIKTTLIQPVANYAIKELLIFFHSHQKYFLVLVTYLVYANNNKTKGENTKWN